MFACMWLHTTQFIVNIKQCSDKCMDWLLIMPETNT